MALGLGATVPYRAAMRIKAWAPWGGLLLCGACASAPRAALTEDARVAARADAVALVDAFIDGMFQRHPGIARSAGVHAYDGRLMAVGPEAVAEEIAWHQEVQAKLSALDRAGLADPVLLDVELAELWSRRKLFELETLRRAESLLYYADLFDVSGYVNRAYAPKKARIESLLSHFEQAVAATPAALGMLRKAQVRTVLETGASTINGLVSYLQKDVRAWAQSELDADAALRARFDAGLAKAVDALGQWAAWIQAHRAQAHDRYALGAERFLGRLAASEGVTTDLAALRQMAQADFEKNRDALLAVAAEMAPGRPVTEVIASVTNQRLSQEKVLERAEVQLSDLRRFLLEQEVVDLGGAAAAEVRETPPYMRWNSAFLDMTGPYETPPSAFYYISPPDPAWPAEVQASYIPFESDLLATSVHEVYPGHFVHGLHQRKASTRMQKLFDSYAFTEGWAHYTEALMVEVGYRADEPAVRVGQLINALLRNCRFLAAIGLHADGMSVPEAQELFETECFIDPGNAAQQAVRGTFDPGYMSYTFGKLQILGLRARFQARYPKRSLKDFHDWLLSFGAAPLALIERRLGAAENGDDRGA